MIPQDQWKWFGFAGHFILGPWCRFHMCTQVGSYIISTVGFLVTPRDSGGSEEAEAAFLAKNSNGRDIGAGRTYETMVFMAGRACDADGCGCGQPIIADAGCELAADTYRDPKSATEGHYKMCLKFAGIGKEDGGAPDGGRTFNRPILM